MVYICSFIVSCPRVSNDPIPFRFIDDVYKNINKKIYVGFMKAWTHGHFFITALKQNILIKHHPSVKVMLCMFSIIHVGSM